MSIEFTIDSGIAALLANEIENAREQFAACVEREDRTSDALYLMGICCYLEGDEAGTLELLEWSAKAGEVSQQFFPMLGRIIDTLGPEKGENLRKHLQLKRRIPWQLIGTLGKGTQADLEPWFFSRRAVNLFPTNQNEFEDPQRIVEKYILPGFLPPHPLFKSNSALLTMGSCFAQELRNYLSEKGMRCDWLFVPPGLNNTFALRNFIEWCITGTQSSNAYWYDEGVDGGALKWTPDAEQHYYKRVLEHIDGLVLTVGLAEVWYDTTTNGVFWRGVPKSIYNPDIHKCRMSTAEENTENLAYIIKLLHGLRPNLPVVITLSPIPLRATFEDVSCFVADCVSKSTLRVAIDNLMQNGHPNVMYWPSFEIVRWMGGHVDMSMFGEDGNTRHVNRQTVKLILESFIRYYYAGSALD